jgi:hypothetical protein
VFVGGFEKHAGHSASTAFLVALAVEKVKLTLAEIIPATNVPCPLFPALEQGVEWTCTEVGEAHWKFVGRFLGQPLGEAVIVTSPAGLTLDFFPW